MATSKKSAPSIPRAPGEISTETKSFREFEGMNTQASRTAIEATQFSILENVMPIGKGNLKAIPQIASALAVLTGEVAYYEQEFNISNTAYMFFAVVSGAAYQVKLSDGTVTKIANAGTFSGANVQIAQWKNERILIIDTTGGYRDWDGTTLTNNSGVSGSPSSGTAISTFAGRVWVVNGTANRTISWSNTAAYADFTGTGGSTTISDEVLTSKIIQLLSANNFLYFFGIDSINIIADTQVVGGALQFSNTNISANSGTDLPQAIVPYYRSIWYMNRSGIFALYGATPRKASDDLDGIFPNIDFTKPVTCGTVVLYNILCVCFMFTYNDPTASARKIVAIYFGKKWFIASQSVSLTLMGTSHGSTDSLYGTDGTTVYQMFGNTTADISQTIKTRLWDFEDFISTKESIAVGVEGTLPATTGSVSVTVDTETSSEFPSTPFASSFAFTWTNSLGNVFTWTNSLGAPFMWIVGGYVFFQGDVQNSGRYLGITVTSTTAANIYNGLHLAYRRLPATWGS